MKSLYRDFTRTHDDGSSRSSHFTEPSRSPISLRHALAVAVFTLALFGLFSDTGHATHFRYGNITWSWVSGTTVTFHVTQAWRRSFFSPTPVLGGTVNTGSLVFGAGSAQALINLTVTQINTAEDWFYGEATITYTYPTGGVFTAYFTNCCRISSLANNNDQNFRVQTTVTIGNFNSSPVSTMPPMVYLPVGQAPAQFQIFASDPDGQPLQYRLATPAEMGGSGLTQPPGLTVSPTGLVSFNTVGRPLNQLWNTQVIVSDGTANIAVDLLIRITAVSNPPNFDYAVTPANGTTYDIKPGDTLTFQVKATDIDSGNVVTLFGFGLPAGALLSPVLPISGNPVMTTFRWVPTMAQLGARVVNFTAQDNVGASASTSVNIIVSLDPVFDSPPTPGKNLAFCISPNVPYSAVIQTSTPDPNATVQLFSATLPSGATMTPNLPTAFGATASSTLNWTPTHADWGHNHLHFTAKDNFGHTTQHEFELVVNTPPTFASTPSGTTISVNQPFSYAITVTDPEVPFGDDIEIHAVSIPAWMTLTPTGTGTAILSGTPGPGDVGTVSIQIDAEDIHHHCTAPVSQTFDVTVNPCTFTSAITPSVPNPICPGTTVQLTADAGDSYAWSTSETTQSITVGAGTYTVTVTSGFCTSTVTYTVTEGDLQPPTAAAQNVTVFLDAFGNASVTAAQVDNGSSDNCGIATMSVSPNAFTCANLGGNPVTLTVFDGAGNSSTASAVVTVVDNSAPTPVAQNLSVVLDAFGNASITAGQVDNGSFDNCGITSMSVTPNTFTCADLGANSVTFTVFDAAGNSSSTTAIVTVGDNTAPTALAQNVTVFLNGFGNASVTAGQVDNGSFDNCGVASMSVSPNTFTCANLGANPVTLTVFDGAGNSSTASAVVTVVDNSAPMVTLAPTVTLWPPNHQYESVSLSQMIASIGDNCSSLLPSSATILSVSSDEPEDARGNGDGNTLNDIVIMPGCKALQLRAERAGGGNGRVYTVTFRVLDGSGNATIGTCAVVVPHNQGSPAINSGAAAGYTVAGCGAPKAVAEAPVVPEGYGLEQNYPNPFNPTTTLRYSLPVDTPVRLMVFDAYGRQVATLMDGMQSAGTHSVLFDARNLASGMYVYRMEAGQVVLTRTMSLTK